MLPLDSPLQTMVLGFPMAMQPPDKPKVQVRIDPKDRSIDIRMRGELQANSDDILPVPGDNPGT